MKRQVVFWGVAVLLGGFAWPALPGTIDPGLAQILEETPGGETVSTIVFLSDRVDIAALDEALNSQRATLQERHETVVTQLQEKASATQGALRAHLKGLQHEGRIERFEAFWISNCFRVDAVAAEIELLAAHPDVDTIYFNYPIELIEPEAVDPDAAPPEMGKDGDAQRGPRNPEPGLVAVRAPEVWAMGFTGTGVLVSTLDTGVDGNHPALASRWRGVADVRYAGHPEWAFFDPVTNWTFPQDGGSHGTHTMGTVCGGAPGDEVGVAPGAQWINAAVIDRVSLSQTCTDAILAFQWLIDPDGDPETNWDVPAVCSNSWGIGTWHNVPPYNTPCDESFWSYLDACEAAGTVILFSAGNEGSSPNTLRRPADRATDDFHTCAVGGIDANGGGPPWPMYPGSSRGPTYCTPDGTAAIKPEIAAPAMNVRSSVPGGGYAQYTGTSMASPHVNGVVALMREACPDLTVQEVKEIIYLTALDQGAPGKDNDYGYGVIDAYEAVNMALDWCGPSPPRVYDGYFETPVDTAVTVDLQASDHDGGPEPISFKIVSLPPTGHTLTDVGNGHVILAEELPYTLVSNGNQVTYTPTGGFYGNDTFEFVANDGGTPPEGGDSEVATVTGLVLFGPPVIITDALPDGCLDRNYGPVDLEADQGQPELVWEVIGDEYFEYDLGVNQFALTGIAMNWHADDNSWSYTLPFAFPFFGVDYTTMWVCSNGFVNFNGSDWDYSNSDSELIQNVRIAPLWDDLRTDYSGDIYIHERPDSVTIRWEGERYGSGDPVNFSVVLSADGTIQFDYGSGNTNLSPTIGISAGDGTHYLLSMYNNATTLTWADSLKIVQPVPLPEGMTLSTAGQLSGVPIETGVFEPRIRVTDSLGRMDQTQLALEVLSECTFGLGDMNCSGTVNAYDIDGFVCALSPTCDYEAMYPDCDRNLADCNGDGDLNAYDIDSFIALVGNP